MSRFRPHGYFGIAGVVLMVLIIVPVSLLLLDQSTGLNRSMARQKGTQAARRATHSLMTDFMSQFTKGTGYFEDHYAPDFVNRTKTLFENSFAEVTVIPNRQAHTLLIRARGENGVDPKVSRGLEVLIHFVPVLGHYFQHMGSRATLVNRNSPAVPFSFPDPVRADGNLSNEGTGAITFGNIVVAGGNIDNSNLRTVFKKHLYYGGTLNPPWPNAAMYQGGVSHIKIPGNLVPLDNDFYQINATTQAPLGTTVWWDFRDNAGTGEYRSRFDRNGDHRFDVNDAPVVWSPWTRIPPAGGIFLGRFSKTYVSGTVRGRVTVVSLCPSGCNQQITGTIEVVGPTFSFPGAQRKADGTSSIHLFSNHGFYFNCPVNSNFIVSACIYADDPLVNSPGRFLGFRVSWTNPPPRGPNRWEFYGSWNNVDGTIAGVGNQYIWDENLKQITAPGVPERPVILSWRRTS